MNGNENQPDPAPPEASEPDPRPTLQAPTVALPKIRLPKILPASFRRGVRKFSDNPRWFDASGSHRRFRLSLERGALLFAAVLFGSGIVTFIAASTGTFRIVAPVLWIFWALAVLALIVPAALRRFTYEGDWGDLVAVAAALLMGISAGALHHHYYAAQADIGFYVTDAMATATTGGRILQGTYDGLLPGFTFTPEGAKASAMFGYSSVAAMFAYAFGMFATPWVNAPFAFLAVLALYRVARALSGPIGSIIAILLWITSLLTVWMTRWTMTENAAIPAFWIAVLLALTLWHKWDAPRAIVLFLALAFGGLARPDGIMLFAWFLLILLVRYRHILVAAFQVLRTDPRYAKRYRAMIVSVIAGLVVAIPIGFLVVRALPTTYINSSFSLASGFFRHGVIADAHDVPVSGATPNWGDYALRFEWESSLAYYLPWILLVGLLGVLLGLVPWRKALLIALFLAPYTIFVFMPPVTTAHPWFMRRLWIAFIPFIFLLAGATLDFKAITLRWPRRISRRIVEPRPMAAVAPILIALLFVALNVQTTLPIAFKREQDSVAPVSEVILDFLPPGSAVIIDEDVVEYASVIRFHHDGPVVPWFNMRAQSFFASVRASEEANGTVIIRIPAVNRNYIDIDARGAVKAELHNATVENTVRRDFRNYIARPPLPQGYAPLGQYLDSDVPPNRWVVGDQPYQLLLTAEPMFLQKNIKFDPNNWGRGPLGMYAVNAPSALNINLSKFRADILTTAPLSLHLVYVQSGNETREVTAPGLSAALGVLPSDGSETLREASIRLPSPMNLTTIHLPQGTILRGILMDLG